MDVYFKILHLFSFSCNILSGIYESIIMVLKEGIISVLFESVKVMKDKERLRSWYRLEELKEMKTKYLCDHG